MKKIVVAGGEPANSKLVAAVLRKTDYDVTRLETQQLDVDQIVSNAPDLLIWDGHPSDLGMATKNGYRFKALLLSGDTDTTLENAVADGFDELVYRPFKPSDLRSKINKILTEK